MITLYRHIFNITFNDISDLNEKYQNEIHLLKLSSFKCPNPSCNSVGACSFNTHYKRYVINKITDCQILDIAVIKCNDCGRCHALLPAYLYPFHSYSYLFVMNTLFEYYYGDDKFNKSRICNRMMINRNILNQWLSSYNDNNVIEYVENLYDSFLKAIHDRNLDFYAFLWKFTLDCGPFLLFHLKRFFIILPHSNKSAN